MTYRLVDLRRAAELFRRHGAIASLAALVMVGFAALAAIGSIDRRDAEAQMALQAAAGKTEAARATLERQLRSLETLAAVAATASDEAVQRLLDLSPSLTPATRAAALFDATGMPLLQSAGARDAIALAVLGGEAAREFAADPALPAAHEVRDGELSALARPWFTGDGKPGGIALIAIDGVPHATAAAAASQSAAKFATAKFATGLHGAWPFVAITVLGVTATLSLIALLVGRLHAAERELARQAGTERDLRWQLARAAASADRSGELSRAKSQFFAQATHELRTPLNAILGFSEAIRQQMFGPVNNPRYLEYAGLINDAGSHLLSLINDLLDNASIEAGKMEITPIRMSTAALARSALDLVELLAESRDIKIATAGLTSCPDLNVDPRAMKQVLVNLLSNAIKYTPAGGRIDVSFGARDAMSGGGIAIEIADTGIGMSTEDLRVAFEPFGRANAIEARRQQGTGLGLSLARALVRLHGGELTLTSSLDAGTTARVVLPAGAAFLPGPRLVPQIAKTDAAAA
jgi:signal transduction histidine kinase